MSRPCRSGNQVSVDVNTVDGRFDVGSASEFHLGTARRVRRAASAPQQIGGREQLDPVANGGNWFACFCKVANDVQHSFIQTQVFGGSTTGQ